MYKPVFAVMVLTSIFLSSCDMNAGTTNISLQETATAITEVTPDKIQMNNCGGKGDVKQTSERKKSVTVDISGTTSLDAIAIKGDVAAKYSQVNEASKSIELVAPPGTNMEFSLEWTETSWLGIATSFGKDGQATYKVSVPISVSLISSNDLGCTTSGTGSIATTAPDSSTSYFSDDFNSGSDFAQGLWRKTQNDGCNVQQKNGQVEFSSTGANDSNLLCAIFASKTSYEKTGSIEAAFSTSSGATGDYSIGILELSKGTFEDGSQNWIIQCGLLQIPNQNQVSLFFNVHSTYPQGNPETSQSIPASTDHWYKMKLEIIPHSDKVVCYADGNVIGTYQGNNLVELHQQEISRDLLGFWSPHSQVLFYADDLKLSPP